MNQTLIDFFECKTTDTEGRTLQEMRDQTDIWLETSHNYIQWLFPNREPSSFNPDAPLLDDETVAVFRTNDHLKAQVALNLARMVKFYQLDEITPWWVTKNNHNYLRLTRILHCLVELEMYDEADELFNELQVIWADNPNIVGALTYHFWSKAIDGEV